MHRNPSVPFVHVVLGNQSRVHAPLRLAHVPACDRAYNSNIFPITLPLPFPPDPPLAPRLPRPSSPAIPPRRTSNYMGTYV